MVLAALTTLLYKGKIKYRPCNPAYLLSSTPQPSALHNQLALANEQLPVEGTLCCLLPHGQHAMLVGFVLQPPDQDATQRLRQQLLAAGHEGVPTPPYWAVVRGSDDPDSPEACILPGMVATPQGVITRPVTPQEALAVMHDHVLPHLAAMPRDCLWAGAPLQLNSVLQCCQEAQWGRANNPGQAYKAAPRHEALLRVEVRPALASRLAAVQAPGLRAGTKEGTV